MKLRTKYLLTFFSSTLFTLIVVALSIYGFYKMSRTTNYLVTVNSRVMEYANLYEKDLAQSRRAEKEFFIFPNNPQKQEKYVGDWKKSMDIIEAHLAALEDQFISEQHKVLLNRIIQAKNIIAENRKKWEIVVSKFQESKSYDAVNKAEYGEFKERIHVLEDIGKELSAYGIAEVEKGRLEIEKIQSQTESILKLITVVAILWGVVIPIVFARRMTSTIIYLSKIADDISKGRVGQEIKVNRKDELGDLAQSIKRMQVSLRIMLERLSK